MSFFQDLNNRFKRYKDNELLKEASLWFETNYLKLKGLASDTLISKLIFEPFLGVFENKSDLVAEDIYKVITKVAIINAVLAGLPGKLGIGVAVSIGFEFWMAYMIAQYVGFKEIKSPSDVLKYFGLVTSTVLLVLMGFRQIIGFFFSAFSFIPWINPLILAEIFATNLVGLVFMFGFQNILHSKEFSDIKLMNLFKVCKGLSRHQYNLVKNILTPSNIKETGKKLLDLIKGDLPADQRKINGEMFSTVAMGYLVAGQYEKLEGPLGEVFLKSIRLRWSSELGEAASREEISDHFQGYGPEQLAGASNTIKGKMFEILVEDKENLDSDNWKAMMYDNESFPGSDIIFYNQDTNAQLEVSLKAVSVDNTNIIEKALVKYPDQPIMTTDEVADLYESHPNVFGSGFTNEDLDNITDENLQILLDKMQPVNANEVVVGGVIVSTFVALWPFVIAYLRKKMRKDQLERVFKHVLGDSGVKLVSRISYAVILGPVFAWWLLARGVGSIVDMANPDNTIKISLIENTNKTNST